MAATSAIASIACALGPTARIAWEMFVADITCQPVIAVAAGLGPALLEDFFTITGDFGSLNSSAA